jgi:methylthioribose-1-phosphate isomerase
MGEIVASMSEARDGLSRTRPTAVNLFWALERMERCWINLEEAMSVFNDVSRPSLTDLLVARCDQEALAIHREDVAMCRAMGAHGASLLSSETKILTHCNTGALATGGHGTALGVIRSAWADGKLSMVYADETRPFLQGSRLTAWELHRDDIPVEVICEGMAAHLMSQSRVDAIFVGADRIAANGDAANKIGTYGLAIIARAHQVPFYVVAPTSTVDLQTSTGVDIPIEQRDPTEVTHCGGRRIVPEGVGVQNPAFDVTPADYITAIITEQGVIYQGDFIGELRSHVQRAHSFLER